ncbi:Crp/Fnr family transcriptional regulator [Paracoccus sp. p4-l81]|uniref:Crp/Fnr family transcriptional regulator n=1 Tax=unclassified Paracoccus (in: a-proteobacteria) TaxID=2688777 RepID=UPI0035B98535
MTTPCHDCPLRCHDLFEPLTADEIALNQRLKAGEMTVDPQAILLMEGAPSPHMMTVLDGMGLRYKLLPDGERQVLNFVFPGDFLGLQAGTMGEMRHSVIAVTPMTVCLFRRSDLETMVRAVPQRALDLAHISTVEEHFLGEALARVGQQSATERMAWALLRVFCRLRAIGMSADNRVPFPYRQRDLADALGLSLVHTNKTLARLRESGVADWAGGWLIVHDIARLSDIAEATPDDLLTRRPLF